jgi:hypothetical protein
MDQRQLRTSRRSTIRFIIYAVFVFLVYRLLSSFWSNDTPTLTENIESPPSSESKDAPHQNDQIRDMPAPPVSDSDDTEPEKEYDLPWYPKKDKISTADRIELELKASIAAREMAHEAFRSLEIQGIPGSAIKTAEQAQLVHSQVDCFTQGSWVYDPRPRDLLTHLQESLYSKCDKRYERDQKDTDTSEWKVRNELKYIWIPVDRSQCPLTAVDKSNWCEILDGRHMLLVGDILQFQMHELLLDTFRDGPAVCYGELNCKGTN